MNLASVISRPLLAAYFIADGIDAALKPQSHAVKFRKLTGPLERAGLPPVISSDAEMLARVSGAASAVAGVCLAVGRQPRLAAAALLLMNAPITLSNNPVWTADDETEKKEQWRGLLRGLGLSGGLLLAACDRAGKPSIPWRMQNARDHRADLKAQKAAIMARYTDQ